MSILKRYNKHLRRMGYNGPLTFHKPFELGHIITFAKQSGFEVVGHINDPYYGLSDFEPSVKTSPAPVDIDYGDETGVRVNFKTKAMGAMPKLGFAEHDTGLVVGFENTASYMLKTSGTQIHLIENIAQLGQMAQELFKQNKWNKDWYVITELVEAECVTLLIAKGKDSKIAIKSNGNIALASENDLVRADIGLDIAFKHNMDTKLIGKQGPYFPLFKANGIKKRRLFQPTLGSQFGIIDQDKNTKSYTSEKLSHENGAFSVSFLEHDFLDDMPEDIS